MGGRPETMHSPVFVAQVWGIFPAEWHLPQLVCLAFCTITKSHLAEILDAKVLLKLACSLSGRWLCQLCSLETCVEFPTTDKDLGPLLLGSRTRKNSNSASTAGTLQSAQLPGETGDSVACCERHKGLDNELAKRHNQHWQLDGGHRSSTG